MLCCFTRHIVLIQIIYIATVKKCAPVLCFPPVGVLLQFKTVALTSLSSPIASSRFFWVSDTCPLPFLFGYTFHRRSNNALASAKVFLLLSLTFTVTLTLSVTGLFCFSEKPFAFLLSLVFVKYLLFLVCHQVFRLPDVSQSSLNMRQCHDLSLI